MTDPTFKTDGPWGTGIHRTFHDYEVDNSFWALLQRMRVVEGDVATIPAAIAYLVITGTDLYVHLTDHTILGPYTIPVGKFNFRGAWAPLTSYFELDTFTINGALYVVLLDHTSAATFDSGANDGHGHDFYAEMLALPGNSLPAGGAARQNLKKSTNADYAVTWGWDDAVDVTFEASTASGLVSDNVADALDELAQLAGHPDAAHVTYEAPSGSWLTATNAADAIDQLSNIDAREVKFEPSSASGLSSNNVADALDELAGLDGGGGSSTLHGLTDVNVTEGAGINGYVLYWNNSAGKWQAESLGIGSIIQAYDADLAALAANSTDGLWAITGAGTGAARTISSGNGIGVTNGDGVSGNPTIALTSNAQIDVIEFVIDGAGSTLTTGLKGYLEVPFACTIVAATLLADQSGSVVVDIFKCTYSSFDASSTHPVSGDKITSSSPPTISTATKSQDTTLSSWTTSISAGDILAFNVNSITTITRVTVSLKVTKV